MLKCLLRFGLAQQSNILPDNLFLLATCLQRVLPICNSRAFINAQGSIKSALFEYVKATREEDMYAPFVNASNPALARLRDLEVDQMKGPGMEEGGMFFQRNDPRVLSQPHRGVVTRRKPDVILPFEHKLHHSVNDKDTQLTSTSWDEYVKQQAAKKPQRPAAWRDVLGVIEFKRSGRMQEAPMTYNPSAYQVPTPELLLITPDGIDAHTVVPTMEGPPAPAPAPRSNQAGLSTQQPKSNSVYQSDRASGTKRSAQVGSESRLTKRSKTETEPKKKQPSAAVQTALYAVEMFSSNLAIHHAINFTIRNDVIWIWYYDRQGIINAGGINVIQDLPRYLVLLCVLQRLQLCNWGRNTAFEPHLNDVGDRIEYHTIDIGGKKLTLHSSSDGRVSQLGLKSRGSDVIPVTCDQMGTQSNDGMVAKLCWGEESRKSESTILKRVAEIVVNKTVDGHVPVVLFSYKFPHSTSAIREALKLAHPGKGSRSLFIIISHKLRPIKELKADIMFKAWYQCVECHYALWQAGIYHRDVSCENLMYYMTDEGVMGVLNDFDLASVRGDGRSGNARTGTIPFMAIELLREDGQSGSVEHIYRHDMESFICVFIWICFQYNDGKMVEKPRPLDMWAKVDPRGCAEKKTYFLNCDLELPNHLTGPNRGRVWSFVDFLGSYLHARVRCKMELQMTRDHLDGLPPDDRGEVERKITQLTQDLAEEPLESVFTKFTLVIQPCEYSSR
ncbi:hypothetical protein BS17DRAFT_811680 [Gyrodon lividus]|nr:hypothetical protein BS17DRAFT_811680 [Gyrodon lividus]